VRLTLKLVARHLYRTHDRIVLALLDAIAEGKNRSYHSSTECNTKNNITFRMGTHDAVVKNAIQELQSKGLVTSYTKEGTMLYEITEKGEQYRMLARRLRNLLEGNG